MRKTAATSTLLSQAASPAPENLSPPRRPASLHDDLASSSLRLLNLLLNILDSGHVSPDVLGSAHSRDLFDRRLYPFDLVPRPASPKSTAEMPEDLSLGSLRDEGGESHDRQEARVDVERVGRPGWRRRKGRESETVRHVLRDKACKRSQSQLACARVSVIATFARQTRLTDIFEAVPAERGKDRVEVLFVDGPQPCDAVLS